MIFGVINDWQSLKKKDDITLNSKEQVLEKLKVSADQTKQQVIAKMIENNLHNLLGPIVLEPDSLEDSLKKVFGRRKELFNLQDEEKQKKLIKQAQESIDKNWDSNWKESCLAKETLRNFINDNFHGSMKTLYPTFKENICKKMFEKKSVPEKIIEVLKFIHNEE